ncbi:MAG TPA: serine/threonine-protein kinase [Bryobacteraceae bacterium]
MNAERWQQVKAIFDHAVECDPASRGELVRELCGDDESLLEQVESLLASDQTAHSPLPSPADLHSEAIRLLEAHACGGNASDGETGIFIGPYRLVRQIGEGGMGVVYHAQQVQPIQRDVALKIIKPGMDSQQVIARFESERQALAIMDHPNIARVFDAGSTSAGRPYFVMELVDGVPISRYCDSKQLTVKERVELFIQVGEAIQHAHQKGIIHRDIKPSNLLVAEQEGRATPKVIDFGLAKALGPQLSDATLMANFGAVMGTLCYMSPEQADSVHDIDTRSDVYSLGVVLYELLTGKPPMENESLTPGNYVEALRRIREEDPPSPSLRVRQSSTAQESARQESARAAGRSVKRKRNLGEVAAAGESVVREFLQSDRARLVKELRGELDWITMKALEKDRERRYQTAIGLARDLKRYLEGDPVEAGPVSVAYRLRKFVGKHRPWLAAAAAFTVLLVAGAVISSWMALRASRAEQEAHAVNAFLQNDLLAQASANNQAHPDTKPDPHLEVRTALDRAAARIEGKFRAQPLVEASIRQTIGETYKDIGLYAEAQRHLLRALDLRRRALGEQNADTLRSMERLAELYSLQGKYTQAEPLNVQLVEIERRVLGEQNPDTLEAMHNLAILYGRQNEFTEAEELFKKVVDGERRLLGEEDSRTMAARQDLATLYQRQGDYAKAEPLYSKALEVSQRVLGEEHPDTLVTMSGVAVVYQMQGKYAQAEPLESKVLETQRRVLGEEHLFTLNTMNHLASLFLEEGKQDQAEVLYRRTLSIQRRVLGEEHPETLLTMVGLGNVYRVEGDYARAESLYTKALEIQSRTLGEEYRDTRRTMSNLAELYRLQGKYGASEALYLKVLEMQRRLVGQDQPDTLATMNRLAALYLDQRRYAQAEALSRVAYASYEKTRVGIWERFNSQSLLGESLAGQTKYADAEPLLLAGYDGMKQREATIPAAYRPLLDDARKSIVQLYKGWGKPYEAGEWQRQGRRP